MSDLFKGVGAGLKKKIRSVRRGVYCAVARTEFLREEKPNSRVIIFSNMLTNILLFWSLEANIE